MESMTDTQEVPIRKAWTPDTRILNARIRWDVAGYAAKAAMQRQRADDLETAFTDPLNPLADAYGPDDTDETVWARFQESRSLVLARSSGYNECQVDAIARYITVTGRSLWHACWVLGNSDQPCPCAGCERSRVDALAARCAGALRQPQ